MKVKVSISIDEGTLQKIDQKLTGGLYRNKSHYIEYAVKRLLENDNNTG